MPAAQDWALTLYTDHVLLLLDEANEDLLKRLALQGEGYVKVNIQANGQIDTGFMLNSTHAIYPGGDTYSNTDQTGLYINKEGGLVEREIAPINPVPDGEAWVVVGAVYAIYQEVKNSFLYRAAQQLTRIVQSEARTAFKRFW